MIMELQYTSQLEVKEVTSQLGMTIVPIRAHSIGKKTYSNYTVTVRPKILMEDIQASYNSSMLCHMAEVLVTNATTKSNLEQSLQLCWQIRKTFLPFRELGEVVGQHHYLIQEDRLSS